MNPKLSGLTPFVLTHDVYWAIEPLAGARLWKQLQSISIQVHQADVDSGEIVVASASDRTYPVEDGGIAVISMVGPMTKSPTSFDAGCSTVRIRGQIRAAVRDSDVKAIMLRIDSPGGSVSGTADLAKDVAAAAGKKPFMSYYEDSGCSAAFWVGSQAGTSLANPTAIVGSIGTYMTLEDWAGAYEEAGVKVHVIGTGPYKGAGAEGAPVTDDQVAEFKRLVLGLNEHFLQGVAKGRGLDMSAVRSLADGRVHVARSRNSDAGAKELGLIDGVATFDKAMADLRELGAGGKTRAKAYAMSPLRTNEDGDALVLGPGCRVEEGVLFLDRMPEPAALETMREQLADFGLKISASDEDAPIASAEATLETARIAAESATERIAAISAIRASQSRAFSPARLEQAREALTALSVAVEAAAALPLTESETGDNPPADDTPPDEGPSQADLDRAEAERAEADKADMEERRRQLSADLASLSGS
jgi:signal peptide peptidase SppA